MTFSCAHTHTHTHVCICHKRINVLVQPPILYYRGILFIVMTISRIEPMIAVSSSEEEEEEEMASSQPLSTRPAAHIHTLMKLVLMVHALSLCSTNLPLPGFLQGIPHMLLVGKASPEISLVYSNGHTRMVRYLEVD